MPSKIDNNVLNLSAIEGVDCIGDSRQLINTNTTTLGNELSTVSVLTQNLNTSFNTNNINSLDTLTTLVSSLSVFSPTGNYLGYIPIYK
jgi:hypothetical protein